MKDIAGAFRGHFGPKSCPEFRNDEDGKTRCSYCDCVPLKHVEVETEPVSKNQCINKVRKFYLTVISLSLYW